MDTAHGRTSIHKQHDPKRNAGKAGKIRGGIIYWIRINAIDAASLALYRILGLHSLL